MKRRNKIWVVCHYINCDCMTWPTSKSEAEEVSLWMCVVQPFATVQADAAYVYCVFLGTCHTHCVPGDFCWCKIILFALYLMTVDRTLSTLSRGTMTAKWKIRKDVKNVITRLFRKYVPFRCKKIRVRFRIQYYCYQALHSSNYFPTYSPPLLRHLSWRGKCFCIPSS